MDSTCHDGACGKCWAAKYILFGVVLFVASWYAKSNGDVYIIWYTLAALLVLKGIIKMAKPCCPHCEAMPMKKGRK